MSAWTDPLIRVQMLHPEGRCSWAGFKLENGALGWTTMERIPGTPNVWVTWDALDTRAGIQPEYLEAVNMKTQIGDVVFETRTSGPRTFVRAETPSGDHLFDLPAASLLKFLDPERQNNLQRARREGYVEACRQHTNHMTEKDSQSWAAKRYPLTVTRPRKLTIQGMDATVHADGSVTVNGVGTFQRSTLQELLTMSNDPMETVESTEVER